MERLTPKQKSVLDFIRERVSAAGLPPTLREIGSHFGFASTGTVRDHLAALARKGYLTLTRQKARAIELDSRVFGIPILGRVQAGEPKLAEQDIEGYLEPYVWAGDERLFALKVKGDSMKDAGILEGDTVVVRKQAKAEQGEIVVAIIGDEATVKRFGRKGGRYFLFPANDAFGPIPVTRETAVLGKVVTVLRNYV
jgi:repressor LexA